MLGAIGSGHRIVWVNVYSTTLPETAAVFNATLAEFDAAGRLDVVDYAGWIVDHPEFLAVDGVHLTSAGQRARTAVIAAAVGAAPR